MKYLVIYDSIFGNTEKIALAVAGELARAGQGQALRVKDVKMEELSGMDLLVVGSPTRGFRPTPAIKNFLKGLPPSSLKGVRAGAFDTRMVIKEVNNAFLTIMVGIFGYAAQPIAKSLAGKGAQVLSQVGGFFVKGSEGPLKDGELERAAEWARQLASAV
ncbi:MAG: flavodoxin family protein [Anaerolineaceae bacterium]